MFHPLSHLTQHQRLFIKCLGIGYLLLGLILGIVGIIAFVFFQYFLQLGGPQGIIGVMLFGFLTGISIPLGALCALSGSLLVSKRKRLLGIWCSYLTNLLWVLLNIFFIFWDIVSKKLSLSFFAIPAILMSGFIVYYLNDIHRSGR
jgi:hypothetical protein